MATILERNGGYMIMVSEGYGLNGRQKRKTMTWRPDPGMTKRQIKEALNTQAVLFERRVRTGQVLDGHVTFAEFVERWKRDYAEPNLAPKTLLRLLDNEPYQNQVMIRFFLLSGVRRGELCGLEWKDIDFDNHMITICRTSQYLPEKGIFTKGTKTDSSVRTIKLPEQAFELLKAHRKWQRKQRIAMGDHWVDSDRIFAQDDGTPVHPDSITGWFHDFISRTDLPQISIHSLRHTNITLLLAAGIPLKTVSYRAGHAQTSTTANIYSHAIRTADEKAAEVLENIVKKKQHTRVDDNMNMS